MDDKILFLNDNDDEFEIKICWLKIDGLISSNCIEKIKKNLKLLDEDSSNSINIEIYLDDGKAFLEYDSKLIDIHKIIKHIEQLGYKCDILNDDDLDDINEFKQQQQQQLNILIVIVDGMTCKSCTDNIEKNLLKINGIINVNADLITKKVTITYQIDIINDKNIILENIENLGFDYKFENDNNNDEFHIKNDDVDVKTSLPLLPIRNNQEKKLNKCFITITGMTCSSCVSKIERNLSKITGIHGILVALLNEKSEILYDKNEITTDKIIENIIDLGFNAKLISDNLNDNNNDDDEIYDLSLCIENLKLNDKNKMKIFQTSQKQIGIKSIDFINNNHNEESIIVLIKYNCNKIGARKIIELLQTNFYSNKEKIYPFDYDKQQQQIHRKKQHSELIQWRNSFLFSLLFFLPSLLLMLYHMIVMNNNNHNGDNGKQLLYYGWSYENFLQFLLSTPIQFYGARYFYIQSYKAIKYNSLNMDVLIMLATNVAYFYSLFISLYFMLIMAERSPKTFFDTPPMLLTFISLGRWLEHIARGKTSDALTHLMSLKANNAILLKFDDNNENIIDEKIIDIQLVERGDIIKVLPGQKIPVDGRVFDGNSNVDESLITGESKPVIKTIGSSVIGGSINMNGTLLICATHIGRQSTLSSIVNLVEKAQLDKAPIQRLADYISGIFVPIVIFLSLLTLITWIMIGRYNLNLIQLYNNEYHYKHMSSTELIWQFAFQCSITVLLIACPCSLGLATPTAIMVGTGVGALNGILIKSGIALENFYKINCLIFDKTGTITYGTPQVIQIFIFNNDSNNNNFMEQFEKLFLTIWSVENQSEHPIGKSLVNYCQKIFHHTKQLCRCIDYHYESGYGIRCRILSDEFNRKFLSFQSNSVCIPSSTNNNKIYIGNSIVKFININNNNDNLIETITTTNDLNILIGTKEWMLKNNVHINDKIQQTINEIERQGSSIALISINNKIISLISLSDTIKFDAKQTIQSLKKFYPNLKIMMITGDNKRSANRVAKKIGINPNNVISRVLPSNKSEIIKRLQFKGNRVAMVGDGINDSPALACADIGIAFSTGTDVANEVSDIILINNQLYDIVDAIDLSYRTIKRIHINIIFATIYNLIGIPMAAGIFLPFGIVIRPWMGSLAMTLSSISVVCSSLLLKNWKRTKNNNKSKKNYDQNNNYHKFYNDEQQQSSSDEENINDDIDDDDEKKFTLKEKNIHLTKILNLMPFYNNNNNNNNQRNFNQSINNNYNNEYHQLLNQSDDDDDECLS